MEAVPKLPLFSFELKTSPEGTHFGPKLKQYIAEAYREDPDSYSNEIHQLEGLRSAAVRPTIDAAGLSALTRYFCQLRAMQSRFPMSKGQPAACSFSWKDLYASMSCSLSDIRFEMACILYNIGALHTQLGAAEPRNTADSLKAACTHFQNAAWAFQHLREHYPQPTGVDVSTEIMRVLQEVCFAQAQECILEKSIQDTRKATVIGAVATQVAFFYKSSLAYLGPSVGQDTVHEIIGTKLYNVWHRYLSFKSNYVGCIVCLYQGMHAEEQQKMGERVAFYQIAVDKLEEARKLVKYIQPVQVTQEALTFTNDVVEGKRKAAKNENEFIYHEEVPEKDLLADMKPVCLVKALPINFNDPEISGPDIFSRLVPMGAHEASSMYSEEKAKLLRHIVSQVEAKNTELMEFMSSLQLDQLDVLDSDHKVPQEIVDRCAAMNAKAETIQALVDSMNNLAEIISDVEHSLAEIKNLIQEETLKEKEYQKVMGPRPPSIVQTELSREYHKYQEAHTRTNESNQVLHKAMTLHIANLRLLSQPLDVLESKIPSIDNIAGLDRETMTEMRRVVGKVREMQTQRDSLVQQLREAITADDITAQLLARAAEPTDEIFKQELEKHTPKVKIIEQNLAAQENIINKLTSVYASYGDSRRMLSDVLRKREGLINALITSYDTYEELLGKSQKGQEFYKKLSHNVSALLARLRSTCQVQAEERQQLLTKNTSKAPTPVPQSVTPPPSKTPDMMVPPGQLGAAVAAAGGSRKLKDYLPYMKNRGSRSATPQGPMDPMPQDSYYPDNVYPTSIRPAPVGSEDVTQMQLPDGVVMPQNMANPYGRYPYAPEQEPYAVPSIHSNYAYQTPTKPYDKMPQEDLNYGYSTYTPPQYSSNSGAEQQIYSNPYYSATQNNTNTIVTDSQNFSNVPPNVNPVNMTPQNQYYDTYTNQMGAIPETTMPSMPSMPNMAAYSAANQTDLSSNFAQMQVTPKPETNYTPDYSQTYYNVQYPHVSTPNVPNTYTSAAQNSSTSMAPSQVPSEYNSLNYPYSEVNQFSQVPPNTPYNPADQAYSYATTFASTSQGLTYSNAVTSMSSMPNTNTPYSYSNEIDSNYNPALAQLDAFDKPIKSHTTGEALSNVSFQPNYQGYNTAEVPSYTSQPETYNQTNTYAYTDQTNTSYGQPYQNHPGYNYNQSTGTYDYNYGSQNTYSGYDNTVQGNLNPQEGNKDPNWQPHGIYTSAGKVGNCETVQSPTENTQNMIPQNIPQNMPQTHSEQGANQYYTAPYGYQTTKPEEFVPNSQPVSTNYGADVNQSTYMQSGQGHDTSVTYTSNQVSSPTENITEPKFEHDNSVVNQNTPVTAIEPEPVKPEVKVEVKTPEVKTELSAFDLLSDIDFSVEQTPLMPEIKVPQISESAIKKVVVIPKVEPVKKLPPKEEVIERPAKRDLFSDPSLLNRFTQEVKNLQRWTDSLTNKVASGITVLDYKWKSFQDVQTKENMTRSKTIAMQHTSGNIVSEIVPFDDSRLRLKSDPDAYINASYYKQLAPWCIPLVISKNPSEDEYSIFWKAILENKISCIACLLSEIEMQGKTYWPTAKGTSLEFSDGVKVFLDEVTCTVHWTERELTIAHGKTVFNVTHYQINVFPAKIVCSPLVLLADKILSQTYDNKLSNQLSGAWVHCGAGGGRSAVVALLLMVMCQVRAGQMELCDMLDAGCVSLYTHRSNVLEDTKYLADAYRTALFYVQGVLCSGTTMFNGEAVSVPSGAAVLPPVTPTSNPSAPQQKLNKFCRESFEEMKQSPGLKSGDMKDPLNFLDPLWSLKKK
ncbi:tyrosine-protein phosphatase non-receptor type protein myopic isoform X2 [Anticarsia gemmatalis]|uniref:tyrosine-protein phosphatase non-receptor type protein myopic isoform X2 n=1 Tax=Anticarsia gemmatalis TaxID=129554 RepID=UPI003F77670E